MKRILSAILAVVLSLSVVTQNVYATELLSVGEQETAVAEDDIVESEEPMVSEIPSDDETVLADPLDDQDDQEESPEELPDEDRMLAKSEPVDIDEIGGFGYNYIPGEGDVESISVYADDDLLRGFDWEESLPTYYRTPDSYLPSLRDQGIYGTCWAHSNMALAEIYMKKQGVVSDPNYSELHLSYFSYYTPTDPLGGTVGDLNEGIYNADYPNCLQRGGNLDFSANILASWIGVADESVAPYSDAESAIDPGLPDSIAFSDVLHIKNHYRVATTGEADRDAIKRMVRDLGGAGISYYALSRGTYCILNKDKPNELQVDFSDAFDMQNNCYYFPYDPGTTNHAVTIVGWDDSFSKYNFVNQPEGNGAWLIRNSWFDISRENLSPSLKELYEQYGIDTNPESSSGYFWLSYYDKGLARSAAHGFEFEMSNDYARNYQYDGSMSDPSWYSYYDGPFSVANIFRSQANSSGETLRAVSVYLPKNTNVSYRISVYLNPDANDPASGTLVSTAEGSTTYAGYYTVPLSQPVILHNGDSFSVVEQFEKEGDSIAFLPEGTVTGSNWYRTTATCISGQSFYKTSSGSWKDLSSEGRGNIRIKAFTTDGASESSIPYYVVFHANNGGNDSTVTQTIYRNTSTALRANTFSKTGHSFYRWNTKADGSGNSYSDGYSVYNIGPNYGTIDLYAQWTPNKYTVTLNPNGGSCATSGTQVTYGNVWSLPPAARDGYTFVGWFTSATGGSQITNGSTITITQNTTLYAHWQGKPLTVSFDANGGNCNSSPITVYYEGTYGNLPTPTRAGYDFAGWFTEADGGGQISSSSTVAVLTDHTLYAHWTPKTYTVTFNTNANGASVSGLSSTSKTVTYMSTYGASGTLPALTRTGYNFVGWYDTSSSSGGNKIEDDTPVTKTKNHTIYARWTAKTYTVYFNANAGTDSVNGLSPASKSVTYGSTYGNLPTPSRTGYDFVGWFTTNAATGGTQITAGSTVSITSVQTLYARWTAGTYTVYFDANAGTDSVNGLSPASKSVTYGSTYGNLPTPTRTGYGFAGWFTTNASSGGTQITAGSTVSITAYQTLYARWTANTYTVTFDANAGFDSVSGLDPTSIEVSYGSTYGASGTWPAPTRTGYKFEGWYTEATGGIQIKDNTKVTITSAQTLYAQWTIAKYTVTYNAYGGHFSDMSTKTTRKVTYGSTYGASGTWPNPTRTGYDFAGWFTTSASSGGDEITAGTRVTINADQTLYARWTPKTYTVSFNANAGFDSVSGLNSTNLTVTYERTYGASGSLPTPARTGYDFVGWFTTDAATGGSRIENETVVRITSPQTLYARWTLKSFTVTIDGNGGNWNGVEQLTFQKNWNETLAKEELGAPAQARYRFTGWYDDPGQETEHDFTAPIYSELTIYAGWKRAEGFRIEGLEKEYVYTGSAIKPEIEVYDDEYGTEPLILNTDYTLTYKNNTNVGTASLTVKGKGNYSKELPLTFEIKERNLSDNPDNPYAGEFNADDIVVAYNARKAQSPNPVVYRNGKKLVKNRDYRVHWINENDEIDRGITESDTYDVMITGVNNYTGTRKIKFTVAKQEQKLISKTKIKVASVEWTGNAEAPVVTVTDGKTSLFEGTHYEIIYPGNADPKEPWKDAGTVPIMIKGIEENGYAGSVRTTYQIKGTPLNAGWFGMNWWPYSEFTYTGEEQEYEPWNSKYGVTVWLSNGQMVELKKGTDFEVRYENNINAGRATAVITGKGRFTGTVKKTFTIKPDTGGHPGYDYSSFTLIHTTIKVPFEKGGCRPKIETLELRWDHERDPLKLGKDYTLSYRNNQKLPDQFAFGDKAPQIVVKGIGNYKGMSFTIPFEILAQSIADSDAISVDVPDMVFIGKAGGYAVTPILTDQRNHKQLANNKDFKVLGYYYAESISAAEEKVYRMDRKQKVYLDKAADEAVDKKDIIPAGTKLYVRIQGINGYTDETAKEFTVAKGNLSKAKVNVEVQEYTGSEIKITKEDILSITGPGNAAISEDDYEILNNYSNNTKPGTASVTLRGKGNYAGVKTVTFKIRQRWLFFPGIF
ncbi:MAG: InlB B-repeat-containing protein [Lachnospiraceae bacterium]|nr:InlB B-repeat-containing protein [Lachnospiraceae bacterium]